MANSFHRTHKPHQNSLMMGDFNSHHNLSYVELATDTSIYNNIRNNKKHADTLIDYPQYHDHELCNIAGTFTHKAQSTNRPTTLALTFIQRHATTIVTGWSWEPGSEGSAESSNHAKTIAALGVGKLQLSPHRLCRLTDWQNLKQRSRN